MSRSRGWCFTVNNWTDDDVAMVMSIESRYKVVGYEVGDSGTPHLQGYLYFDSAKTEKSVRKMIPRAHIELQRGTNAQAIKYCKEDGDYWEEGEEPRQGLCSWNAIQEVMKDPTVNFHLYNQYRKSYNEFIRQRPLKRDRELRICSSDQIYNIVASLEKDGIELSDICIMDSEDSSRVYNGEKVLFTNNFKVERWMHGLPEVIIRGYEHLRYDPDIVYFICSGPVAERIVKDKYSKYL